MNAWIGPAVFSRAILGPYAEDLQECGVGADYR
jgi:hypothetical protein